MVDSAESLDTLKRWAKERYLALKKGHDYRTTVALIPWGDKKK